MWSNSHTRCGLAVPYRDPVKTFLHWINFVKQPSSSTKQFWLAGFAFYLTTLAIRETYTYNISHYFCYETELPMSKLNDYQTAQQKFAHNDMAQNALFWYSERRGAQKAQGSTPDFWNDWRSRESSPYVVHISNHWGDESMMLSADNIDKHHDITESFLMVLLR